jgi:diguanylate cyclase (GGDEF)-like protein/PAS domain S-box-containing protein
MTTLSGPINLMIVEDERVVAFDLKNQLMSLGYHVGALVGDGEKAVRMAEEMAPDLILMDIHLEGEVDGVQAATRIQERQHIPVIYLTAFAEEDTLIRALASKPFGYLVKPWDIRELHASIQMAIARRELEVSVENNELRLKLAIKAASLGVFEWLPDANRLYGDDHMSALLGSPSVPLDEPWEDFLAKIHPEDREKIVSDLNETLLSDQARHIEFRTEAADGEYRFLEAHVKATPGLGNGYRVIGVLRDITERHLTEDLLRQSSVVFHATAEAIVIADHARRIKTVNAAFTRITGYSDADAYGFDVDLLLRVPRSANIFDELANSETGYLQGESIYRRRSGEHFPAWQNLSVIRGGDGQVTHFVLTFSDVSSLHAVEEKLNHLAHHDPLTELPNRLLFEDRFAHAIEHARRKNEQCLLLFLDLDDFKIVNDTLGHSAGDELLREVSRRLRMALRSADTVARLGGDEFVILATDTGPEFAAELAQKILNILRDPIPLAPDRVVISGSIGIAVYPEHGDDPLQLMRAADIAMYSAKAAGRNRYQFYSREMAERSNERLSLEQGLRRAILDNQLLLHYQPQVELIDGRICGVEALVRWNHPERGMIPPSRFIPVAEESGVIDSLGRWVLEHACRELVGMKDASGSQLRLAVNASSREFMRHDFVDTVYDILSRTGFPPAALEIEITESTLQVIDRSRQILVALKRMGISISIDDFGTGYSSLSVLRDLPIDRIKIDRSFIQQLPENMDKISIVEAMVALAKSLHMKIVVEGIERSGQAEILRHLGCDEGQGYLFGYPMPYEALCEIMPR